MISRKRGMPGVKARPNRERNEKKNEREAAEE